MRKDRRAHTYRQNYIQGPANCATESHETLKAQQEQLEVEKTKLKMDVKDLAEERMVAEAHMTAYKMEVDQLKMQIHSLENLRMEMDEALKKGFSHF